MRVAVGAYTVCTNSFSHDRINVSTCESATRVGADVLTPHDRRRTAIGAFLDVAAQSGIDIVPLPLVTPGLGGLVTHEAQASNSKRRCKQSAMSTAYFYNSMVRGTIDRDHDPDESLMATLRDTLGEQAAWVAALDGHANLAAKLVEMADLLVAVKTNPHHDFFERGQQIARAMQERLNGRLSPVAHLAQLPMLPSNGKFANQPTDASKRPKSVGRSRVDKEIEDWVVRMARENRSWGCDRIQGSLKHLGYTISDQTVGNMLKRHGVVFEIWM